MAGLGDLFQQLMNYLGPSEAGAEVIPQDPAAQQLMYQTQNSPYAAALSAAQADPRQIKLWNDRDAAAAVGEPRATAWGTSVGQYRPEVYVTPESSIIFRHPGTVDWLGQHDVPGPPLPEQTLGHELGHVLQGTPGVQGLMAGQQGQGQDNKEFLADLIAANPSTERLKGVIQTMSGDYSWSDAQHMLALYGDILRSALGDKAAVLSGPAGPSWSGAKPPAKRK